MNMSDSGSANMQPTPGPELDTETSVLFAFGRERKLIRFQEVVQGSNLQYTNCKGISLINDPHDNLLQQDCDVQFNIRDEILLVKMGNFLDI